MVNKLFLIFLLFCLIPLSFWEEGLGAENAGNQAATVGQTAQGATSTCNQPVFIPNPSFQSRTIWATHLVLANGRALRIQAYILNECSVIAILSDGSGRILDQSQVNLAQTEQYVTTEQEARRLSGNIVMSEAPGESDVIGIGYFDFGRTAAPGAASAQPAAGSQAQGGTSSTQGEGAPGGTSQ